MGENVDGRSGAGEPPVEITGFVGRKKEVRQIRRLLQASRLVTVTGVAGVGKSRVAVEAASGVRRAFADGVHVVELAGVGDPGHLELAVARALDPTGTLAGPGDPGLAGRLGDGRALLVLDSCEHLVDACAELAQTLLENSPELRILATSRQPLGVPGEHIVALPPMALPGPRAGTSPAALARYDAVALFLERVTAANPGYAPSDADAARIAEICVRLEGIPLAIELAAARAREIPLGLILRFLGDRLWLLAGRTAGGRHPTVGATVEWSHELCTADERLLWARLPVFVSSFDVAAAEVVCSDGELPPERVLPALLGLVDKSIVVPVRQDEDTVYRLPGIIREYGVAAGGVDRERLRRRHLDHYSGLARRSKDAGRHGDQLRMWIRVRRDWPNLRAALDLCAEDVALREIGLMTAASLWYLWVACGMLREGRHHLERLLALPGPWDDARAWGTLTLVYIAEARGDLELARSLLEECAGHSPPGDPLIPLVHLKMSGTAAFLEGDTRGAERMLGEAAERLVPAGEVSEVFLPALIELGTSLAWGGETARAGEVFLECRRICAELGEEWASAYADYGLGLVALAEGDAGRAAAYARDSLRVKRRLADAVGIVFCLELLGCAAACEGDLPRAGRLLAAARAGRSDKGLPEGGYPVMTADSARWAETVGRGLPSREAERAAREGAEMGLAEAVAYALGEEPGQGAGDAGDAGNTAGAPGGAVRDAGDWAPLTRREREVAELVADGLTNRQIAHRLMVVQRTVDSHVEHILAKLDFSARAQIAAWATRRRRGS
ncbi:LuxR C-terminal-related transcriptional regulator [Streptosporangium sp. NPDC048047]|uniref:ATP-binding protein n=1 Tax=Streptosporangium sp. NPDC048047 TaxID=3155748 RepID=UPI00341E4EE9